MSYSVVETHELPPMAVSVAPSPPPPQNPISSDRTCHGVQLLEMVDIFNVLGVSLMTGCKVHVATDVCYRLVPRCPAEHERSEDDGDCS